MRSVEDQLEDLKFQRIREIREAYERRCSPTYDEDLRVYLDRMDAIFASLSEEDHIWLDDQLVNRIGITEEEANDIYRGGFRDAVRLLMFL
ncbi:hypothetical protein [Hungatella effluvii]|uniref:hypothetical protein n=1 Tax=Hungatella effluvii TaxID=1096246 RepID=UPI0022E32AFD|nr:hypothetical protein [Hungatella effluvii]